MRIIIDLPKKTKVISLTSIVAFQNRYDVDAFTFLPEDGASYELVRNENGVIKFRKEGGEE